MGSLVAELAEKLSSATNSLDFDEQTLFLNTSANTVGVGTNAPASKFDVRGTMQVGLNDTGYDVTFFGAAAGAAMIWDEDVNSLLVRGATADAAGSSGTLVLQTAQVSVEDGDILGRINFNAPLETQGSDAILAAASIWAEADATFTASVNNTELVFGTATTTAAAEKMRLDSAGQLGIGTATPAYLLDVQGTVGITGASTMIGALTVGINDTGHDVILYGATASRKLHWDESADELLVHGKISQRFGSAFKNQTHAGWVMGS